MESERVYETAALDKGEEKMVRPDQKREAKPKSIVLEVQSLRHTVSTTIKPQEKEADDG